MVQKLDTENPMLKQPNNKVQI